VIGTFDAAFAASAGARPGLVGMALLVTVAIAAVAAFEIVGAIIVVAMFICPAATARLMTDRLGRQIAWSLAFAVISALLGYVLATQVPLWLGARNSVSASGMICAVSGALLLLAALFGPRPPPHIRGLREGDRGRHREAGGGGERGAGEKAPPLKRPDVCADRGFRPLPREADGTGKGPRPDLAGRRISPPALFSRTTAGYRSPAARTRASRPDRWKTSRPSPLSGR